MEQLKNNIRYLLDKFSFDESEELSKEINHAVFDYELYLLNNDREAINLYFTSSQYLIPVFSDYKFIKYTLENMEGYDLDIEIATGQEILSSHFQDIHFFGLAVNPPYYDYVLTCNNFEVVK